MNRSDARPVARTTAFNLVEALEPRRLLAASPVSSSLDLSTNDHAIRVDFDASIDPTDLAATSVLIENLTTGSKLDARPGSPAAEGPALTLRTQQEHGQTVPTPGHYLPNGNYEATLFGPLGGADEVYRTSDLFFYNGDFNRDRRVDMLDFVVMQQNFGRTDATFETADATGDGKVDLADFLVLRQTYGSALAPPPEGAMDLQLGSQTSESILPTWGTGDFDAYDVWRRPEGGDWDKLLRLDNRDADAANDYGLEDDIASFTDSGLTDGTRYDYFLRGVTDAAGAGALTGIESARTVLPAPSTPETRFLDDGTILLTWDANSTSHTHFAVDYSADAGTTWQTAGSVDGWQSYFFADTLPGTPAQVAAYQFRVRAETRQTFDVVPHSTSAWTLPVEASLDNPAAVAAVYDEDAGEVLVSWSTTGYDQNRHRIEFSNDAGATWADVPDGAVVGGYDDETVIRDLRDGAAYNFRVRAERVADAGGVAELVEASEWVEVGDVTVPLTPPSAVNAVAVNGATVRVEWSDASQGNDGYLIERRSANGTAWHPVGTAGADAESFTDTTIVDADQQYVYRVSATNGSTGVAPSRAFEDPNAVAGSDADGEHVGNGGWSGEVYAEDFVKATANEMNGPHAYITVQANAHAGIYYYADVPPDSAPDVRDDLEVYAESLVGKSLTETITFNGETIWDSVVTVERVEWAMDNPDRIVLIFESEIVAPYGEPYISYARAADIMTFKIPSSATSATVTAAAGGTLWETIRDDPELWFPAFTVVALFTIDKTPASVSLTDSLSKEDQETYGSLVNLNWDNDNGSAVTENWSATKDFQVRDGDDYAGENGFAREGDLKELALSVSGLDHGVDANGKPRPNAKLTGVGDKIRVYADANKREEITHIPFFATGSIHVEGIKLSGKLKDITLIAHGIGPDGEPEAGAKAELKLAVGPVLDEVKTDVGGPPGLARRLSPDVWADPTLRANNLLPSEKRAAIYIRAFYLWHPTMPNGPTADFFQTATVRSAPNNANLTSLPSGIETEIRFQQGRGITLVDASGTMPFFGATPEGGNAQQNTQRVAVAMNDTPGLTSHWTLPYKAREDKKMKVDFDRAFFTHPVLTGGGLYFPLGKLSWKAAFKGTITYRSFYEYKADVRNEVTAGGFELSPGQKPKYDVFADANSNVIYDVLGD